MTSGSIATFFVSDATPSAPTVLVLGLAALQLPLFGGTLVPDPVLLLLLGISPTGHGTFALPLGVVPPGLQVFAQTWHIDPAGAQGWTASNAQLGVAP